MRRAFSAAAALFWIAGAGIAWMLYASDARARTAAHQFVDRYHVAERYPAHAATIALASTADLANEIAADVALQDISGSVDLSRVDAALRQLWISSVARFDDELADARGLLVEAVRLRPGWAFNRALLGELEFLRARRQMALPGATERWFVPLRSAMSDSPGEESFASFAGSALLEAWPYVGATHRGETMPIFRRALRDPQFVQRSYLLLIDVAGHDAVFAALPESAPSIRFAIDAEAEVGDVDAVARLFPRWERVEWKARVDDLAAVRERERLADLPGAKGKAILWLTRHAIHDFDTPAGWRQLSELLAAWPHEPGTWRSDPRADIIQFLLEGRTRGVDGRAIRDAAALLAEVPPAVAARAALLAGDRFNAERIARGSATTGSFEWTDFYVDLAMERLAAGDRTEAAAALALVAPAARGECDVAIARAAIDGRTSAAATTDPVASWTGLRVPLCLARNGRVVEALVDAASPAVVSFGWDDGRYGTLRLKAGANRIPIPTDGRAGRHVFFLRRVTGGEIIPLRASALR